MWFIWSTVVSLDTHEIVGVAFTSQDASSTATFYPSMPVELLGP